MNSTHIDIIKSAIYTIPDHPKQGIMFRDITGILDNAEAFKHTIDAFAAHYKNKKFTKIVGAEARGFIFGAPLAIALGIPFVPVRKPGKLPRATFSQHYQLEYGEDTLEIHQDALSNADQVLIIDDLLATGGTIAATKALIERTGATAIDAAFVISLPDLGGQTKLTQSGLTVFSLVEYEGD